MSQPVKLKFSIKPRTPALETPSQNTSQSDPSQSYFSQGAPPSNPSQSTPPSDAPAKQKPKLALKTKSSISGAQGLQIKTKKSKAGRPAKPSSKLLESRKRLKEEDSDSEAENSTINVQPPQKKYKVQLSLKSATPKTPVPATPAVPLVIKAKVKGKPPRRNLGEGYDSEASDREEDPAIEEEFVLRMFPGEDCDYLREMIDKKKIGAKKEGADVQMKFFHDSGRRAAVTIRKNIYAATLVDLPCIVEGMKSWDKRGWWKSADICQMLWVFAPVASEAEARTIALPSIIDPNTYQYPHGLTAPLHNVRKRRFRKRIHRDEIEKVENEVERLLKADKEAIRTKFTVIDPERESRQFSQSYSRDGSTPARFATGQNDSDEEEDDEEDDNEDAEGEVDDGYFASQHGQAGNHVDNNFDMDDGDLEADLEAALQADDIEIEAETPMSQIIATPMANGNSVPQEDSGDESVEDDDDDDDGSSEMDEEEKARLNQIQGIKEDIAELENQVAAKEANLASTTNSILRKRVEDNIRKLKQELQLKKSSIGEGEE